MSDFYKIFDQWGLTTMFFQHFGMAWIFFFLAGGMGWGELGWAGRAEDWRSGGEVWERGRKSGGGLGERSEGEVLDGLGWLGWLLPPLLLSGPSTAFSCWNHLPMFALVGFKLGKHLYLGFRRYGCFFEFFATRQN